MNASRRQRNLMQRRSSEQDRKGRDLHADRYRPPVIIDEHIPQPQAQPRLAAT